MGKKRKTLTEKWRGLHRKGTHKHTETYLKYFYDHRCLDQKRINICEHMVKMASREKFWKVPPGGCEAGRGGRGGDGGKIKWKLSEVNTRAVLRGENEVIGFKILADVISIRG